MNFNPSILIGIKTITILSLIGLVITFQAKYDRLSPPFTTRLQVARRNLLPPTILPYITFGFKNAITDYYWISSIQDFVAWNGRETYFIGYFKNISTLDPKFEYPYLFSILTIPQRYKKDISPELSLDEVASISQKGIDSIPSSWKIPFYLATQYYLFTKLYDPAIHYLSIAATRKGAPDGVYLTYSSFLAGDVGKNKNSFKTAEELIKVIYNNTDNEIIKKLAEKGVQETFIIQLLEKAIPAYKVKYGKFLGAPSSSLLWLGLGNIPYSAG